MSGHHRRCLFHRGHVGQESKQGSRSHSQHDTSLPTGTDLAEGFQQDVFTGALEVILIAIKGVVVRITPCPACAVVLGHTHSVATFKAACLFLSTVEVLTWICTQRKKSHLITDYRCCVICCIIPVFCTS
uniref:Uncharacterized protein n=2 Tax=Cyprinus carpio TaxID=7962 RepID=A0A8C1ZA70_CYPCA